MFKLCRRKRKPELEPTDTLGYLSRHYGAYDEDGRLETRHGQVEFLTTMRYIERYLRPGMRVLEIGAATGRYSLALARKGYDVTAIELVQHNIDIFRKKMKPGDKIDLQQGNALDLSRFQDNTFDMTLLLGPMYLYHLFTQEDQSRALSEALRVTKPGGLLYVAYCICEMSILANGIRPGGWFWDELKQGLFTAETYVHKPKPGQPFQLLRREDVEALTAPLPARRLHYVATDGLARTMRDTLRKLPPERFEKFMDYHYFLCERNDMVGATNHSLDVLKKN